MKFKYAGLLAMAGLATDTASADSFTNRAIFSGASTVTASALNAVVASSSFQFQPAGPGNVGGNRIANVGNNSVGVVSIVQNNGAGGNVQQSIVIKADGLTANITH